MRRLGVVPARARAAEQVQTTEGRGEAFAPLPPAPGQAPYRMALSLIVATPRVARHRGLMVVGDTGGIVDATPQKAVAAAMAQLQAEADLVVHLGDVDYFEGAQGEYVPQFFEAYENVTLPFVAIPGNHDGAGGDQLASFMRYFCDQQGPRLLPEIAEYKRDTMDQPNCYWTLKDDYLTHIGLYSNVPSGGEIQADQQQWLVGELQAAPTDRPLIVSLHHPPFSCDAHHGGSERMGKLLDEAFTSAGRWPELVLSGHVHDYQRFTRAGAEGRPPMKYVVCGAGGYHNLHALAGDARAGMEVAPGLTLDAYEDKQWGFLLLDVSKGGIVGEYVGVAKSGAVERKLDSFTI